MRKLVSIVVVVMAVSFFFSIVCLGVEEPAWASNPEIGLDPNKYVIGIGVGLSPDEQMARDQARNRAVEVIARELSSRVRSMYQEYALQELDVGTYIRDTIFGKVTTRKVSGIVNAYTREVKEVTSKAVLYGLSQPQYFTSQYEGQYLVFARVYCSRDVTEREQFKKALENGEKKLEEEIGKLNETPGK